MSGMDAVSSSALILGGFFFLAGTVGLLRFRDVHSRLHALSKTDNLGLGLISAGLILRAGSFPAGAKILIIWLLALLASAVTCYVIAEWETNHERQDRNL